MKRVRPTQLVDAAAVDLLAGSPAFTSRNLFYAVRRAAANDDRHFKLGYADFRAGLLADRLRAGPLPGLLPETASLDQSPRLPREWDAYFPACILLVDRAELIPLFAASGVVVQARMAIVSLSGQPEHIVAWLRRGFREGHRAPIGYLHDASAVVYPFTCALLDAWLRARSRHEEVAYRDLGLPARGLPGELFGIGDRPVVAVEDPPPHAMIAYVARALLAMIPPDSLLFPLGTRRRESRRPEVSR